MISHSAVMSGLFEGYIPLLYKMTLSGYIIPITFLFLGTFYLIPKILKQFKKKKQLDLIELPRFQWTRFRFTIIDGLITIYNLQKQGIKIFEYFSSKCGSIFRLPLIFAEVVCVSDKEVIRKILNSTNPGHLNKHKYIYDTILTDFLKDGLIGSEYPLWSLQRKAINPAFAYKSFPPFVKHLHESAKSLARCAVRTASQTESQILSNVEMKQIINKHSINIISKYLLGSDRPVFTPKEQSDYVVLLRRWKELALYRFLHPELLIRPIWRLHPKKRELDDTISEITTLVEKGINSYRNAAGIKPENLKSSSSSTSSSESGGDSDDGYSSEYYTKFNCAAEQMIKSNMVNSQIIANLGLLAGAGHETVVQSVDMLMFHLARLPEIQEKCRAEVDALFDASPEGGTSNIENLGKLKYLERCILESLRLTPTIPCFVRRLDASVDVDENRRIEAPKYVLISPWVVHRNPEDYPQPEQFDPERFTTENVKKRHTHAFIPFSMGPRNCVGWRLALFEMKVIMAWILRTFEISTEDKMEDVKFLFDLTLKPEKLIDLKFKIRDTVQISELEDL